MRNIILVALLIALATVIGCKPKESQPSGNTMSSTEQPKENMQQSPEAPQDPAAANKEPASGEAAGAAQ
jgi:predicted lipid-binding transport protein (Tim44 family)